MDENKYRVTCKECGNEVSWLIVNFKITITGQSTASEIESKDICLGCFKDVLDTFVFGD